MKLEKTRSIPVNQILDPIIIQFLEATDKVADIFSIQISVRLGNYACLD